MSQAVLDSSHQIWLAGLGAFARAQQEGDEGVRDAGEAGRGTRDEDPPGRRRHRGRGARRGDGEGKGDAADGRAEPGTSSSRCSRIASRARCRSSASTRRTTCDGSPSASMSCPMRSTTLLKASGGRRVQAAQERRDAPRPPRNAMTERAPGEALVRCPGFGYSRLSFSTCLM